MQSDIRVCPELRSVAVDDDSELADLEWRVFRTLLEANHQTNETLETFYYHRNYNGDDDWGEFEQALDSAITRHKSIYEDLKQLRSVLRDFELV